MRQVGAQHRCVPALAAFCLLVGCEAGTAPSEVGPSEVEIFRSEQSETRTTHGRVLVDTVREGPEGTVEYETEDGRTWRTDMLPRSGGRHGWREPEEVSAESQ